MDRLNRLYAGEPLRGDSLLLTTNPQEFLEQIWSSLEVWKAESTLETLI